MTAPEEPELSPARDDAGPALPIPLLHRDGMMLVLDKPAGLPVHRGPAARGEWVPVLTDVLDSYRFGLPRRPEAAHRLDRDTSGCLVLGRHPRAVALLNQLFRDGRVDKTYWAVVEGGPAAEAGLIDRPLARRSPDRGWWMKVAPDGLPSQTRWRVLGRGEGETGPLTWLELEPLTGRTHQIRVHCAAEGWPLLGDAIYGHAPRHGAPPLHLHARRIAVPLNPKREPVIVVAPAPEHLQPALAACGWREG